MSTPVLQRLDELLTEFAVERERAATEDGIYARQYRDAAIDTRAQIMELVREALTHQPTGNES